MNVLKYLESKGIKDNPRIIDTSGQATESYLQTLLEDFKKQLLLHIVSISSESEEVSDEFSKASKQVEDDWMIGGLSQTMYEDYARECLKKYIQNID